jgi:hypothetical protein
MLIALFFYSNYSHEWLFGPQSNEGEEKWVNKNTHYIDSKINFGITSFKLKQIKRVRN